MKKKSYILNPTLTVLTNPTKPTTARKEKGMATRKNAKRVAAGKKAAQTRAKNQAAASRKTPASKTAAKSTGTVRKYKRRNPSSPNYMTLVKQTLFVLAGFIGVKMLAQKIIEMVMPDKAQYKPAIEAALTIAIATFGSKFVSKEIANGIAQGGGLATLYGLVKTFLPDNIKSSLAGYMGELGTGSLAGVTRNPVIKLPASASTTDKGDPRDLISADAFNGAFANAV